MSRLDLGMPSALAMAGALALILVLHPQPRPATPTFLQNSLLLGLFSGCTQGTRLWLVGTLNHTRSSRTRHTLHAPLVSLTAQHSVHTPSSISYPHFSTHNAQAPPCSDCSP